MSHPQGCKAGAQARKEGSSMMFTFFRIILLLAISCITGVLGILWFFGDHTSIWVTVGVKPLGVLMLVISYIMYDQLVREVRKIDNQNKR